MKNNTNKTKKLGNPEHKYKIDVLMKAIKKEYDKDATGAECGMILRIAGNVGEAIVAVNISATWGLGEAEYKNYMPKIRRALQNRRTWPEESHEQAKAENLKFNEWMSEKFASPLADEIA